MKRNISYKVVVDDKTYLRNRIDIKPVRKNETVDINEETLSKETNEEKENEELTIIIVGHQVDYIDHLIALLIVVNILL